MMKDKNNAIKIISIIFGIFAVLNLSRIVFETSVVIGGWPLPVWINWIAFFGTAFLCGWAWSLSGSKTEW